MDDADASGFGTGGGLDGASVGNIIIMLHEAKKKIIEEIQTRSEALHKDLAEKIDAMGGAVVQKVISGVSSHSYLARSGSSRSRASSEKKRKAPPPPDRMLYLSVVLEKDKSQFALQWSMIVSVLSFARANAPLMSWVPAPAREHVAPHMGVVENASGLSTLFFSVEADQKWSLYHGRIGKMWSFVLRSSISSALLHVRRTYFESQDVVAAEEGARTIPPWLASFGSKQGTTSLVSEIIQCLETTDEMARASGDATLLSRRKRMRLEGEQAQDEYESERDFCVTQMRTALMRNWSYGRAEARRIMTGSVLFLIEKILSFPTTADARSDGYEVLFTVPSLEEDVIPADVGGTIWDIPLAATRGGTEDELRDRNNALLKEVVDRFPSLTVTLRYKRSVIRLENMQESDSAPAFWPTEEQLSLHQLALTVLAASLNATSSKIALQASGMSLRTVHVLAVGLRGLIRQV